MRVALILFMLGASPNCNERPSEGIILRIDSDFLIPDEFNAVTGVLTEDDGSPGGSFGFLVNGNETESFCLDGTLPAYVFLGRRAGDQLTIDVVAERVEPGGASRRVVVEQTWSVDVPENRFVELPVSLLVSCADISCTEGETCRAGECRPTLVASESLASASDEVVDRVLSCD